MYFEALGPINDNSKQLSRPMINFTLFHNYKHHLHSKVFFLCTNIQVKAPKVSPSLASFAFSKVIVVPTGSSRSVVSSPWPLAKGKLKLAMVILHQLWHLYIRLR